MPDDSGKKPGFMIGSRVKKKEFYFESERKSETKESLLEIQRANSIVGFFLV